MIDLDDLLAPLADADLGDPLPVDQLRSHAEARAAGGRRRRLAIAGATAVFALVVGTSLVVTATRRPVGVDTVEPATTVATDPDVIAPDRAATEPLPVGKFPYDMLVADGDLWVLNNTSRTVTRISITEHRVVSTIAFQDGWPGGNPNRLATTAGAVWVAGVSTPSGPGVARIDIATEVVTVVPTAFDPFSISARDDELWVAGRFPTGSGTDQRLEVAVQRVEVATQEAGAVVPLGDGPIPVDVALTDDGLWVLGQGARPPNPLLLVDPATGEVVDRIDIADAAVRLVATDDEVVVGTDTSRLGGRTGAVTLVDPATRTVVATTPLDARPEAIVLVDDLIVTSGLRALDRRTLAERPLPSRYEGLGFAMTGDGSSLWASVPGAPDGSATVRRLAIDDLRAEVAAEAALGVPPGWQLIDHGEIRFAVPGTWQVPVTESCAWSAPGIVLLPTLSTSSCSTSGSPTPLPESVVRIVAADPQPGGVPAKLGTLDATTFGTLDCTTCRPTYHLDNGLQISVTGPEADAVLATFTRSGAEQALAEGPLADRGGWQTVAFGGVSVEVPADWPLVDLPGSTTITTTADGTVTGTSGRTEPGGCGGDRFDETGYAYVGSSELVPSCPAPFVLPVHPGVGLWIRAFPDVGHAMFEARPYDGPSDVDLDVVSGPLNRSVLEPVLDVAVDGPEGPVLVTIGSRSDPATIRAILASIRLTG